MNYTSKYGHTQEDLENEIWLMIQEGRCPEGFGCFLAESLPESSDRLLTALMNAQTLQQYDDAHMDIIEALYRSEGALSSAARSLDGNREELAA